MMLALAFVLGMAEYLGSHGHTGAAYALLGLIVFYPVLRFIVWSIKEFFLGLLLGLGARASGAFSSPERAERLREKWQARASWERHNNRRS